MSTKLTTAVTASDTRSLQMIVMGLFSMGKPTLKALAFLYDPLNGGLYICIHEEEGVYIYIYKKKLPALLKASV